MKNIFKVMGVALLACSMIMVSCKKDEDENASGVTVKFGNTAEWNTENIYWEQMHYTSGEEAPFFSWQVEKGNTAADPMTWGMTGNEANTYSGNYQSQDNSSYYVWFYVNNDDDYFQYNGNEYPVNQGCTATTTISALDVTANTVSMNVAATTFDGPAYVESQGTNVVTTDLTINANNVKWTVMTK